jgi:putative ABC transport system permease protein
MSNGVIAARPLLVAVLVVLAGAAAAVLRWGGLPLARAVVVACLRATVQLAAVSLVIASVLRAGWATAAFVALMFAVATITSARRVTPHRSGAWVTAPVAAGTVPVLLLLIATEVVPRATIAVLPIAGILIGGAMTATSLAGRRALDELGSRRGEYEAALALGLTERAAAREICRPRAAEALLPALDQTRTVGLVTLPGAFVGVLLGGGSAVQAGATQVLVLVALLLVEALAVVVTVELVAAGRLIRP